MNDNIVHGFDDAKNEAVSLRLELINAIPHCLAIHGTGYVDLYNAEFFLGRVSLAIATGYPWLVLGMRGISYMSSSGIVSLVSILKAVRARQADLVLLQVQPEVYKVIELLGLTSYFTFAKSMAEAVGFLSDKAGRPADTPFPRVVRCPVCERRLLARAAGIFRCPACKTVLVFDERGSVGIKDAPAPAARRA